MIGRDGAVAGLTDSLWEVLYFLATQRKTYSGWIKPDVIAEGAGVAETSVGNCIVALNKRIRTADGKDSVSNKRGSGYRLELTVDPLQNTTSLRVDDDRQAADKFEIAEITGYVYANAASSEIRSREFVEYLEERYNRKAVELCDTKFPVTIVWENDQQLHPDAILGVLNRADPPREQSSPILREPSEYQRARSFIQQEYTKGKIKHEDRNYQMLSIALDAKPPKISGKIGWYYDGILSQYGMEWELRRALSEGKTIEELKKSRSLPLREAAEEAALDPTINGIERSNNMGVSTLLVFKRPNRGFYTILSRRSTDVRTSSNMLHVVPSGGFVAENPDHWSIEDTVWRELHEELYDDDEMSGDGTLVSRDHIRGREPVKTLLKMIADGTAELSVTGVCCDLLTLRPEICTVLFVKGLEFAECDRAMKLNWEYDMQDWNELLAGGWKVRWEDVDDLLTQAIHGGGGIVPNGAGCIELGRRWLEARHSRELRIRTTKPRGNR